MADAEKTIRLSKAARELNIGVPTIVEFLGGKGHKIESNPNTKIPDELYALLLKEFQSEKSAKEEAQMVSVSKLKRESVVLEADDLHKTSAAREREQEEVLIKNLVAAVPEAPAKKSRPAVVPEPDVPSEDVIKAKSTKEIGVKVVGQIDLTTVEPKSKPEKGKKKKEEPEAPKKSAAKKTKEKIVEEVVSPGKEELLEQQGEAEKPQPPAESSVAVPPAEEIYRRDIGKLQGPTIIGKIELPVEQPRQKPVASSAYDADRKKKRKRKEKKSPIAGTATPETLKKLDWSPEKGRGKPKYQPAQRAEVSEKEIEEKIKDTLAKLSGSGKSKAAKYRKLKRETASIEAQEAQAEQDLRKNIIKVTEFVTANELARLMDVSVTDIISTCMSLGLFVSINQRLDAETLTIVAGEFGFKVEFVTADVQESIQEEEDTPENLKPRPPIVTVMGHVDHGKTSLLDYIRKANVIAGEAGGITQHIGAYEVTLENGKQITFLDTPGHEAFTAMRARGAKVTDVAIIVIAADDSVMPQTVEAINHAQAAGVPLVFAFNKIDKPGANSEKIKEQLANMKILVEDWGGKYQCQEISAKKGLHVEALLEKVLLEAEMLDLKANPNKRAVGTVIESTLDKGRGYVTTLLVQRGTLRVGDIVLAGCHSGRVKAMANERGQRTDTAGPSTPVQMLGMSGAPQAGDLFNVMSDEREAREIANKRLQLQREQSMRTRKHITLDEIGRRLAIGNFKELNVIVKGDVDGSVEALADSLLKLSSGEIQVNVIHKSVGQISETDVLLASASNAIIIGFQVRPSLSARKLAEQEQIDIRLYSIIYDAINEVKLAMEGMLAPTMEEKIVCNVEVREIFKITKVGTVAGCMVLDGKINRNTKIRVVRDGIVVYSGELGSLKRFKEDVKEVQAGFECGLNVANFNDMKVGDIIEGYEQVEVKRTL